METPLPFKTTSFLTDLTNPNGWQHITTTPSIIGNQNFVTNAANLSVKYYRLKK
jgi:hypothetical protein